MVAVVNVALWRVDVNQQRPESAPARCIVCRAEISSAADVVTESGGPMHATCKTDHNADARASASDVTSWWGREDKRAS